MPKVLSIGVFCPGLSVLYILSSFSTISLWTLLLLLKRQWGLSVRLKNVFHVPWPFYANNFNNYLVNMKFGRNVHIFCTINCINFCIFSAELSFTRYGGMLGEEFIENCMHCDFIIKICQLCHRKENIKLQFNVKRILRD